MANALAPFRRPASALTVQTPGIAQPSLPTGLAGSPSVLLGAPEPNALAPFSPAANLPPPPKPTGLDRLANAFGAATQNAAGVGAQIAETAGTLPVDIALSPKRNAETMLAEAGRLNLGLPRIPSDPTLTPAQIAARNKYTMATPETRDQMLAEWQALAADPRTPADFPSFRAGQEVSQAIRGGAARIAPTDPRLADAFETKVAGGLGSMAAYMAGGLAGRALRVPSLAAAGGMGAATGYANEFQRALNSGATVQQAFDAARLGGLVGTSEGVPIANVLDRLDKISGGIVTRTLRSAFKTGTEEAAQEALQTISNNLIASKIVAYDPKAGVFAGVGEGGAVGFTSGALVGALAGMLGGRRAQVPQVGAQPEATQVVELPPTGPEPVNPADLQAARAAQVAAAAPLPPPGAIPPQGNPTLADLAAAIAQTGGGNQPPVVAPAPLVPSQASLLPGAAPAQGALTPRPVAVPEAIDRLRGFAGNVEREGAISRLRSFAAAAGDAVVSPPTPDVADSRRRLAATLAGTDTAPPSPSVAAMQPVNLPMPGGAPAVGGPSPITAATGAMARTRAASAQARQPILLPSPRVDAPPLSRQRAVPTLEGMTDARPASMFDPTPYLGQARAYVRDTRRPLSGLARSLGLSPQKGQRVLQALAGQRDGGLVVGRVRIGPDGQQRGGQIRRASSRKPQNVLDYIASRGGIRDDEGHDILRSILGGRNLRPGFGPLVRSTGEAVDRVGEYLAEAGHLPRGYTEADVLELLDNAARGIGGRTIDQEMGALDQRQAAAQSEAEAQAIAALEAAGEANPTAEDVAAVLEIAGTYGLSIEAAVDSYLESRAIIEEGANEVADPTSRQAPSATAPGGFGPAGDGGYAPSGPGEVGRDAEAGAAPSGVSGAPGPDVPFAVGSASSTGAVDPRAVAAIKQVAQRLVPGARVDVVDNLFAQVNGTTRPIAGQFEAAKDLITVSLGWGNPNNTVRHEAIHALRALGLLDPATWAILEPHIATWRQQYRIDERYAGRSEAQKDEEAVAHAFGAWRTGSKFSDRVVYVFQRIASFLREVGRVLTGAGITRAEDVFARIESGRIGRGKRPNALAAFARRAQGAEAATGPDLAPPFFSALTRFVETSKQSRASAAQWMAMIDNAPGVKREEVDWSGVRQWLAEQEGNVERDALLTFLRANEIKIKSVEYKGRKAQWPNIVLPLPEHTWDDPHPNQGYGEIVLTLPRLREPGARKRTQYASPHFSDRNVLLHVRFTTRVPKGAESLKQDGERVLVIEEIQSDWHQEGRERGYYTQAELAALEREVDRLHKEVERVRATPAPQGGMTPENAAKLLQFQHDLNLAYARLGAAKERFNELRELAPIAPFRTTWAELALKRMIRFAAESGFDTVAWTTGAQQADRYQQRVRADRIDIGRMQSTGEYLVDFLLGRKIERRDVAKDAAALARMIGPDLAREAVEQSDSGLELVGFTFKEPRTFGGEGFAEFYDRVIPSRMAKLVKPWGAAVREVSVRTPFYRNTMEHEAWKDGIFSPAFEGEPSKAQLAAVREAVFSETPVKTNPLTGQLAAPAMNHPNFQYWQKELDDRLRAGVSFRDAAMILANDSAKQGTSQGFLFTVYGLRPRKELTVPDSTLHAIDITPEMRRDVLEKGLPMFALGGAMRGESLLDEFAATGAPKVKEWGAAADAFVLEWGQKTGFEVVVLFDAEKGKPVEVYTSYDPNIVSYRESAAADVAVRLPSLRLYLTHNHPNAQPLSNYDLDQLTLPADIEIAAVTTHGVFKARRGPVHPLSVEMLGELGEYWKRNRAKLPPQLPSPYLSALNLLSRQASEWVLAAAQNGTISVRNAALYERHLGLLLMHRLGLIDYAYPAGYADDFVANPDVRQFLAGARSIGRAVQSSYSIGTKIYAWPNRPTEPVRTLADLGAIPGKPATATAKSRNRHGDSRGGADDRGKAQRGYSNRRGRPVRESDGPYGEGLPADALSPDQDENGEPMFALGPKGRDAADGPQSVIPGAERITDKEAADRRARAPLRPAVPQKNADEGLFDTDARKQGKLFALGPSLITGPQTPAKRRLSAAYQRVADRILGTMHRATGYWFEPFGGLPEGRKYLEHRYLTLGKIARVEEIGRKIYETFEGLDEATSAAVYNYMTTKGASALLVPAAARRNAVAAKKIIDTVERELVKAGLLKPEDYAKTQDAYLPQVFLKYLLPEVLPDTRGRFRTNEAGAPAGGVKTRKASYRVKPASGRKLSDLGYTKRGEIPQGIEKIILGEITDPAYLTSRGFMQPMRDIAILDFLNEIAANKDWAFRDGLVVLSDGQAVSPMWAAAEAKRLRAQAAYVKDATLRDSTTQLADRLDALASTALARTPPSNYKRVPDSERYGRLRGMYVRKEIFDDLIGAIRVIPDDASIWEKMFGFGSIGTRIVSAWKLGKVALNPPSQVRNFVSNAVLLHLSGVPMQRVPRRLAQAAAQMRNNGPAWQTAKKYGVTATTFSAQELVNIERELLAVTEEGTWGAIKKIAGNIGGKASDVYGAMESLFKTARIIEGIESGETHAEAAMQAHRAIFDYSLVPPSVRYARNAPIGAPFLTFTYKSIPMLVETAVRRPWKFLPYMMLPALLHGMIAAMWDVDDEDVETLRETFPNWLREKGGALLLPVKDQNGRWQAVDLSYFLPWGALSNAAGELTGIGEGEANLQEAIGTLGIAGGPIIDLITAFRVNKDPFTQEPVWNEFDPPSKKVADMAAYVWRLSAPTWITDVGSGWNLLKRAGDALVGDDPVGKVNARTGAAGRTLGQEIARLAGVNVYPIDPDASRAANLRSMQYELDQTVRRMREVLRDRNLSPEERAKIQNQYTERLQGMSRAMQDYSGRSIVPPSLRTNALAAFRQQATTPATTPATTQ